MMRLLRVEIDRFFSRRTTRVASLGLLGVVVLALVAVWQSSAPASEEEKALSQQYYEEALADWEVNGEATLADCYEQEEAAQEADPTASFDCETWAPQSETYLWPDQLFTDQAGSVLTGIGYAVLLYAFFVGVSFVAAEFATGSMGSWLTFEPRRTRVYASKLAAAGLGVVVPAILSAVLVVGGAWAIFRMWGTLGDVTGELWSDLAVGGLRLTLTAIGVAVLGAAVAMVVRSTAAAIGLLLGYVIVVEGIIGSAVDALKPWLLTLKVEAVLQGESTYWVDDCTTDASGTMCESIGKTVSLTNGAVSLVVLLAVVVTVGLVTFRRRDVG